MQDLILYTIGCPKCTQLEKRLNQKGIKYTICSDVAVMTSLGIKSLPYLKVGDQLLNFNEAWKWVATQEVK